MLLQPSSFLLIPLHFSRSEAGSVQHTRRDLVISTHGSNIRNGEKKEEAKKKCIWLAFRMPKAQSEERERERGTFPAVGLMQSISDRRRFPSVPLLSESLRRCCWMTSLFLRSSAYRYINGPLRERRGCCQLSTAQAFPIFLIDWRSARSITCFPMFMFTLFHKEHRST